MICDYCGKPITGGYYKHGNGYLCGHGDCFDKQFWKDTLDNNVIIINGTAYHKDTTKNGLHCNVKFADGITGLSQKNIIKKIMQNLFDKISYMPYNITIPINFLT